MAELEAMNMKALCITEDRKVILREVDAPKATGPKDVLIKVYCAGICKTDLRAIAGLIPTKAMIPGHEFSGEVVEVGPEVECKIGSYVTADPMSCVDDGMLGIDINGCFAEYVVVPEQAIKVLDEKILHEVGAFIEPLAAAMGATGHAMMVAMESFTVFNGTQGPIGIYGSGRMANLLKDTIGDLWPCKIIDEDDKPKSYMCVIESSPEKIDEAMKYVARYGTLILKSRYYKPVNFDINYAVMNSLSLVGVRYGRFDGTITYAAENAEQLAKTLNVFKIDDYEAAFAEAAREDTKKAILKF